MTLNVSDAGIPNLCEIWAGVILRIAAASVMNKACNEGCGVAVACQSQSGDKGDHNIEQMLLTTV